MVDLEKFAVLLVALHAAVESKPERTKARAVAAAELKGAIKAADRMGLVSTDFALEMIMFDERHMVVDELGERPAVRAVGNQAVQAWDALWAAKIAASINR